MSLTPTTWLLKNINLFKLLPPRGLQALAEMVDERDIERGAAVFRAEEPGDSIYILKKGRVRLSRFSTDGRELILGVVEAGEVFGEDALAGNARRAASAVAVEPARICTIAIGEFQRLLADYPDISLSFTQEMSRRLQRAQGRLADLVFKNIRGRLAGLLMELADKHGRRDGGTIFLDYRITHREMANRIGSTRETVTATLNQFRQKGHVTSQGRRLIITDPESLRRIYANCPKD
jgi:CRP/FNR family cyclic AMP-dependent transcriptional regulator